MTARIAAQIGLLWVSSSCAPSLQTQRNPVSGREAQAVIKVREALCTDRPARCATLAVREVVVFACDARCATVTFGGAEPIPYDGGLISFYDDEPEGYVCGDDVKVKWGIAPGCQGWRERMKR